MFLYSFTVINSTTEPENKIKSYKMLDVKSGMLYYIAESKLPRVWLSKNFAL